jgi:hypothetical protein
MAGTGLRTGPANAWRMNPPMKGSLICPWTVTHCPFARTARRSILAFEDFSDLLNNDESGGKGTTVPSLGSQLSVTIEQWSLVAEAFYEFVQQ